MPTEETSLEKPRLGRPDAAPSSLPTWVPLSLATSAWALLAVLALYLGARGDVTSQRDAREEVQQRLARAEADLEASRARESQLAAETQLLSVLGPEMWAYGSFEIQRKRGAELRIGDCAAASCLRLLIADIVTFEDGGRAAIHIFAPAFSHAGPPHGGQPEPIRLAIPLRQGARRLVRTRQNDFLVAIEEARASSLRLGIGIRTGSATPPDVLLTEDPDDRD